MIRAKMRIGKNLNSIKTFTVRSLQIKLLRIIALKSCSKFCNHLRRTNSKRFLQSIVTDNSSKWWGLGSLNSNKPINKSKFFPLRRDFHRIRMAPKRLTKLTTKIEIQVFPSVSIRKIMLIFYWRLGQMIPWILQKFSQNRSNLNYFSLTFPHNKI
jgi:hypothetical protein